MSVLKAPLLGWPRQSLPTPPAPAPRSASFRQRFPRRPDWLTGFAHGLAISLHGVFAAGELDPHHHP